MANERPQTNQYDEHFYDSHKTRTAYRVLAGFLRDVFGPKSAVDFGCGLGETLRHLKDSGCDVCGIEGSESAKKISKIDIMVRDLNTSVSLGRKYDLAISTEVAEHLPESSADQFVMNMVQHSAGAIFFTAAQPGQAGVGHINCQPKSYWVNKFSKHGFTRSRFLEFCASIALYPLIWDAYWIRDNALVFTHGKSYSFRAMKNLPKFVGSAAWWRLRGSRFGQYWSTKVPAKGS